MKAGVELNQERWLEWHSQHPSLHNRRLYVVILDDDVLLEDLDGIDLICPLPLSQHYLGANKKLDITYLDKFSLEVASRQTNSQKSL